MQFDIVVAVDAKRGIGRGGNLPWRLPGDIAFFRELTTATEAPDGRNAVIMGRKTWESIPSKRRPLPERLNIVISRNTSMVLPEGVQQAASLEAALEAAEAAGVERCFVIGGAEIYKLALSHPALSKAFITEIESDFECDTFFPDYKSSLNPESACEAKEDNGTKYCARVYVPCRHPASGGMT